MPHIMDAEIDGRDHGAKIAARSLAHSFQRGSRVTSARGLYRSPPGSFDVQAPRHRRFGVAPPHMPRKTPRWRIRRERWYVCTCGTLGSPRRNARAQTPAWHPPCPTCCASAPRSRRPQSSHDRRSQPRRFSRSGSRRPPGEHDSIAPGGLHCGIALGKPLLALLVRVFWIIRLTMISCPADYRSVKVRSTRCNKYLASFRNQSRSTNGRGSVCSFPRARPIGA